MGLLGSVTSTGRESSSMLSLCITDPTQDKRAPALASSDRASSATGFFLLLPPLNPVSVQQGTDAQSGERGKISTDCRGEEGSRGVCHGGSRG